MSVAGKKETGIIKNGTGEKAAGRTNAYLNAALFISKKLPSLLKKQRRLRMIRDSGPIRYTEEMAIADLSEVTVRMDSERVQTSSLSNVPEKAAVMLEDGYISKRQRQMDREYQSACYELQYTDWQLGMVDAAMKERMSAEERVIYRSVFRHRMSLRQAHDSFMPMDSLWKTTHARDKSVLAVATEISVYEGDEEYKEFMELLLSESEKSAGEENDDGR